jgi:hypothetical protein
MKTGQFICTIFFFTLIYVNQQNNGERNQFNLHLKISNNKNPPKMHYEMKSFKSISVMVNNSTNINKTKNQLINTSNH